MREVIALVLLAMLSPRVSFAQLPSVTHTGKSVESTIWPTLRGNPVRPYNHFSVKHTKPIGKRTNYYASVSSIEPMSSDVTWYASRGNHIGVYIGAAHRVTNSASVSGATFVLFDRNGMHPVTYSHSVSGRFKLSRGRSLAVSVSSRRDVVDRQFQVGEDFRVSPGTYNTNRVFVSFNGTRSGKISPYVEGGAGSFYQQGQLVSRVGLKCHVSGSLTLRGDIEGNAFSDHTGVGIMPRLVMNWNAWRDLVVNVMLIQNSYMELNGIFSSIAYRRGPHELTLFYRELWDMSLAHVDSGSAYFASNVMVAYSCRW